jgi:hypothetical protein
MATKTHDLMVKVGSYTNAAGEQKNRWVNVGLVLTTDDGREMILLNRTFNPAGAPLDEKGGDTVLVSKFPVREGDAETPAPKTQKAPRRGNGGAFDELKDDLPF